MRFCLVILLFMLTSCATSAPKPKLVSSYFPPYPAKAYQQRTTGLIVAMYDINDRGKVENVRILSSQPQGVFDATVIHTLGKWQYESHKPVNNVSQTIKFQMKPGY